jgi:hypothetical protein
LIDNGNNRVIGTALISTQFDIPVQKKKAPGWENVPKGFGERNIEDFVSEETGRMNPWNLWLTAKPEQSQTAMGNMAQQAMKPHVAGLINLSLEIVVPATKNMAPPLIKAISNTQGGLKMGNKNWGDLAPFRQQYFERWSPAESLYKQRLRDAQENLQFAKHNAGYAVRDGMKKLTAFMFSGFGESGDDEMYMRGLSDNLPRDQRDKFHDPANMWRWTPKPVST